MFSPNSNVMFGMPAGEIGRRKHQKASTTESEDSSSNSGLLPAFPTTLDRENLLEAAYNASLTGGNFFDTKFYVFSRRRSSGVVDTPRAVYANSAILRASSRYFTGLLTGGFAEGTISDLNAPFPCDKKDSNPEYEYEEDSDLEDMADEDAELEELRLEKAQHAVVGFGSEPGVVDPDANLPQSPLTEDTVNSDVTATVELGPLIHNESVHKGRVIVMPDVAFATWRALIFYLGTGKVSFSPLRSQGIPPPFMSDVDVDVHKPPSCSPKSMYRLACQLQLDALAKLAFDDIHDKISSQNILHELFSAFSARYPDMIETQTSFCRGLPDKAIIQDLPQWSENIARGHLPHSAPALAALVQKLMASKDQLDCRGLTPVDQPSLGGGSAPPVDPSPLSTPRPGSPRPESFASARRGVRVRR